MLDIGSAMVGDPDDVVDQLKIRSLVSNGDGAAASLAIALRRKRAWLQLVARCLLFVRGSRLVSGDCDACLPRLRERR